LFGKSLQFISELLVGTVLCRYEHRTQYKESDGFFH